MRAAHSAARVATLCAGFGLAVMLVPQTGLASEQTGTARAAMQLFAQNCFSPFLTAQKAARLFALSGSAYDFYDLDPFSSAQPSEAKQRRVTPGTDRRCEISFAGNFAEPATQSAVDALAAEGILTPADLPDQFTPDEGTTLLAARRLNPARLAVVHVGTRKGTHGIETFMLVERMKPSIDQN